jgi:hypothetical protein
MQVFVEGFTGTGAPLRNGEVVSLADGLDVKVFVDPYPLSGTSAWFDLSLSKEGQPIGDAEISMEGQMVYMNHGTYRVKGKSAANGHYVLAVSYAMAGTWRQRFTIRVADQQYELPLVVTVYP